VVIDSTLREKLRRFTEVVEFCDEAGQVLGRFLPVLDRSLYEDLEPQISPEELQRRKQTKDKSYTTAEVLKHLEQL
jgi:hypothetical protein